MSSGCASGAPSSPEKARQPFACFPGAWHHLAAVFDMQVTVAERSAGLTPRLTAVMALAAGFAAANVWYNQPMLGLIARDLSASSGQVALIPTATQVGFAAGILLLLPLGDRMDRRRLILRQLGWLALALVAAALAPTMPALIVASAAVGAGACIAQQIVPFAAELAAPAARGRAVGAVMSGLFTGILLGRVLSGAIARHFGWRAMFGLAAVLALLVGALLAVALPRTRPSTSASYARLLLSVAELARRYPALRRAALVQAGLFGSFSAFWSVLALRLQAPPLSLGSDVAGLFGLLGVAGILAASVAGRLADRYGPRRVVGGGIVLTAASWPLFALLPGLAGLVAGLVLLDLGVQAAQIGNQAVIYALAPEARGRVNTFFMTVMFAGGALGSGAAGVGWLLAGWPAVCAVGLTLALLSLLAHGRGRGRGGP
jgi:predicted MFS family arabinose efflux permease